MSSGIAVQVKALYGRELAGQPSAPPRFGLRVKARTTARLALAVVLALQFALIYYFEKFVNMQQAIFLEGSRLEVEYQRRGNLIPHLAAIAKAYARHERELMNYVSDARALEKSSQRLQGMLGPAKSAQVGKVFAKLIALAEQYPNLKAEQSYQALMAKTVATENRVAKAREEYASRLRVYNVMLRPQYHWTDQKLHVHVFTM